MALNPRGAVAAKGLTQREAPLGEERTGLARHACGQEHSQVADRQHDVIGGAGHARLAHRDRTIVLLGEIRQQLPDADRLATGNDAERPRLLPASLVRLQQLGDRRPHEVRDGGEAAGALRHAACHARCAEEHHAAGRLVGEALEEAMDDEAPQAVTDEMHRRGLELAHPALEPLGDVAHGGRGGGVAERLQREAELVREPVAQDEGLPTRHPQTMHVDYVRGIQGCGTRTRTCSSRSCASLTSVGASVSGSAAVWVFGKAITSRMLSAPVISMARRSSPKAMPPCGGAPNLSASSRKPNFLCASSEAIPSRSNTVDCISWRWMRTEPPPISAPFNTRS